MAGARGLLINITGGEDMTLFEVDQAANRIREEVADDANIIFGSAIDESLSGRVRVSVVATGIDTGAGGGAAPAPGRGRRRRRAGRAADEMPAAANPMPMSAQSAAPQPAPVPQPSADQAPVRAREPDGCARADATHRGPRPGRRGGAARHPSRAPPTPARSRVRCRRWRRVRRPHRGPDCSPSRHTDPAAGDPAAPAPARNSLFGIVTGAIRGRSAPPGRSRDAPGRAVDAAASTVSRRRPSARPRSRRWAWRSRRSCVASLPNGGAVKGVESSRYTVICGNNRLTLAAPGELLDTSGPPSGAPDEHRPD